MFQMNYCEFNRSNVDCDRIFRPGGSGDYLFLLLKTPMRFRLNGNPIVSKENSCILYTPGVCQDYQAVRKFRNSYMHFSTDLSFETQYEIPENQIFYPANYEQIDRLMQEIQKEYLSKSTYYQERLRVLTENLMISLARALQQPSYEQLPDSSSLMRYFQNLRLTMLGSCEEDWDIQRLCRESSMGKSQFYHYYKLFFQTTPKAELLQARMEKARTLLTNEALQVQQVSRLCGFSNVQHFTRYFKEWYQCPPKAFQKNYNTV